MAGRNCGGWAGARRGGCELAATEGDGIRRSKGTYIQWTNPSSKPVFKSLLVSIQNERGCEQPQLVVMTVFIRVCQTLNSAWTTLWRPAS